jgi:glycosyltransferase involved in cell wall biosynthesis
VYAGLLVKSVQARAKCGIHVYGGDLTDLAWGINEVLRDKEEAKTFGLNGRKRVLDCFTWDTAVLRTLKVFQKASISN